MLVKFKQKALHIILTVYASTWRLEKVNSKAYMKLKAEKTSFVVPLWHNDLLIGSFAYRDEGVVTMASSSKDGDIVSSLMQQWGFITTRGSSSSGGIKATLQMIKEAKHRQTLTALTVDGPRGPVYCVKDGVIFVAKKLDKVILPAVAKAEYAIRFRSWDRFKLPLPFSKVQLIFGEPIYISDDESAEAIERDRVNLQNIMLSMKDANS